MEKRKKRRWPWLLAALALVLILLGLDYWNLLPHRTYTAEHFGIETLQSPLDADGDGIDDYTDLMLGARRDAGLYPRVQGTPDPNIDFRRVPNLRVFFERYAESLTTDPYEIAEWQPGDIVTFEGSHIGIISDKRNRDGVPYLIHNSGQPRREEDALLRCHRNHPISGHFRWNGGTETN